MIYNCDLRTKIFKCYFSLKVKLYEAKMNLNFINIKFSIYRERERERKGFLNVKRIQLVIQFDSKGRKNLIKIFYSKALLLYVGYAT